MGFGIAMLDTSQTDLSGIPLSRPEKVPAGSDQTESVLIDVPMSAIGGKADIVGGPLNVRF